MNEWNPVNLCDSDNDTGRGKRGRSQRQESGEAKNKERVGMRVENGKRTAREKEKKRQQHCAVNEKIGLTSLFFTKTKKMPAYQGTLSQVLS